ncbi:MAG: N-acetylmuramoyl-L-alanine amidase [Deltaproteobacteria bacterium]|nr:MAG: N-acetylmuramoyl-L-alanine amidase [Deltaproteobacteria bacterium]
MSYHRVSIKKGLPRRRPLLFLALLWVLVGAVEAAVPVKGVRWWAAPGYTRVVVDLGAEASFQVGLLRGDPQRGKPPRLYVDISPVRLERNVPREVSIRDGLCRRVRLGQFSPQTVRVVLDLRDLKDHHVFALEDPYRVVIDVYGEGYRREKTFTVVVDPGHGGRDPGAIGPTGLKEKDVVLKIAKRVRDKIRRRLGWRVVLTREGDRYIPLEQRTAIANARKGDLFLSIHCNASRRRSRRGVETYFLSFTTDKQALRLAARENGVPPSKIDALQLILYDLMLRAKVEESRKFALHVQRELVRSLRRRYARVINLGVKQAPFLVLVGAKMPSILAEVSFISNRTEERRLRDPRYLDLLAEGITQGLRRYVEGATQLAGFSVFAPSR